MITGHLSLGTFPLNIAPEVILLIWETAVWWTNRARSLVIEYMQGEEISTENCKWL